MAIVQDFTRWYGGVPAPFYPTTPAGLPRILSGDPLPPSAGIPLGFDTATRGVWRGRYGASGRAMAGAASVLPSWVARFEPTGAASMMPGDASDAPRQDGTAGSPAWTGAWVGEAPGALVVAADQEWRRLSVYLWDGRTTPGPLTVEFRDGAGALIASHTAPAGGPRWALAAFRGAIRAAVVEGGSLVGVWLDPYQSHHAAGCGSLVGHHLD